MNLQEKIFNEIRKYNIKKGGLWITQWCLQFQDQLNPLEKDSFEMIMNKLCDEGFF